jgi:hypothetical protein
VKRKVIKAHKKAANARRVNHFHHERKVSEEKKIKEERK